MFKKVICLVLGLLLFLGNVTAVAELKVIPKYVNTSAVTANLSISSKGVASCSGKVTPSTGSFNSTISVNLQQKNGSNWKTLKTWTGSATGLVSATASGTHTVSRGTYRVYVYGYVGTEVVSKYSAEKTY